MLERQTVGVGSAVTGAVAQPSGSAAGASSGRRKKARAVSVRMNANKTVRRVEKLRIINS